jgi:hypothetical protein
LVSSRRLYHINITLYFFSFAIVILQVLKFIEPLTKLADEAAKGSALETYGKFIKELTLPYALGPTNAAKFFKTLGKLGSKLVNLKTQQHDDEFMSE